MQGAVVGNAVQAGRGSFNTTITKYQNMISPTYDNPDCAADLASITYSLGKGKMWAMQCKFYLKVFPSREDNSSLESIITVSVNICKAPGI